MFTATGYLINRPTSSSPARNGLALYHQALVCGWLKKIGAALIGQSRDLHHLPRATTGGRHYAGIQTISVREIVGSEDRDGDFDIDFNPLRETTRDRWLGVFNAWVRGISLPPIELMRGPDGYFVRDRHHRLSVARALGQDYIEAVVMA